MTVPFELRLADICSQHSKLVVVPLHVSEPYVLVPFTSLGYLTWPTLAVGDLFSNYIAAIERHEIVCPRIDVFYTDHLYCRQDRSDLTSSGIPPIR